MLVTDANKSDCISLSNDKNIAHAYTSREQFNSNNNHSMSTESDDDDNEHIGKGSKKKWKCSYKGCSKIYCSKENLNLHIQNIHWKLKPYKCYYCDLRFSHRNGRIYHQKKKHLSTQQTIISQCSSLHKDVYAFNISKEYKNNQNQMFITFKENN